MVAPGMTCQYTVQFFPDCLGDFDDFILVETQSAHTLLIPLQARRPPPVLTCECALLPRDSRRAGAPIRTACPQGPFMAAHSLSPGTGASGSRSLPTVLVCQALTILLPVEADSE